MSRAPYAPFDPGNTIPRSPLGSSSLGSGGWGAPPHAAAWPGAAHLYPPPAAGFVGPTGGQPPVVGFTAPTIIYDKMRNIDASANELDVKIHTYVGDPTFVRAWEAWVARWTPFFQKYQSDWSKLGAAFYSDELNRQTEEFRSQLLGFLDQYKLQRQPNGQPVPQPATPAPVPANDPPAPPSTFGLPWWVWFLGGVAAVGGAYWLYKRYETAQAQKRVLEQEVLPGLIGPGLARAAAAHDPAPPVLPILAPPRERDPYGGRPMGPYAGDPYGVMARDRVYGRHLERSRDPYAYAVDAEDDWDDED